jgi:hypothetical protein
VELWHKRESRKGYVVKVAHIKVETRMMTGNDHKNKPLKYSQVMNTLFHSLFFQHVIPILSTVLYRPVVRYTEYY